MFSRRASSEAKTSSLSEPKAKHGRENQSAEFSALAKRESASFKRELEKSFNNQKSTLSLSEP